MLELANAREQFWATYPKANGHPAAAVRLRKAFSVVDFTYLFAHFYSLDIGVPSDGHGQQRQTLYQGLSGVPPEDDVIDESVRRQFDGWIRAVYNRLNGGFADILNIRNRLPQALNETETQYEAYVVRRDMAEFRRAGRGSPLDGPKPPTPESRRGTTLLDHKK
jgi:hypothetical protein